jgi:hypothetical protein
MVLTKFHIDALKFIINDYYDMYPELLDQIPFLEISDIEHTGVGCFYSFALNNVAFKNINRNNNDVLCGGYTLYSDELIEGALMMIFLREGKIETLEVMAHESQYPITEPKNYYFKNLPVNVIDYKDKEEE